MTVREREAFLAEPRVAVLSVAGEGGRPPLAAPSFYAYEPGGDVSFFTNTERRGARSRGAS
jgi:nitroimidazol reductase NimA-like FMN-containing flavoprotein (pyridoxamine 5'-phosphate oxidase superfamily)